MCVYVCVLVIYCYITNCSKIWWLKTRTIPLAHESASWAALSREGLFLFPVICGLHWETRKAGDLKNTASRPLLFPGHLQQDNLRIVGPVARQLGSKNKYSRRPRQKLNGLILLSGLEGLRIPQVTKAIPYSTIFSLIIFLLLL